MGTSNLKYRQCAMKCGVQMYPMRVAVEENGSLVTSSGERERGLEGEKGRGGGAAR